MRRADRLFDIIQLMRGGRLVTAQSLADRLEVSVRTIYRDIVDLQSTGVPIEGEAGYGYILQDGFDLPPLMFNRSEIAALVAGARLVRAWGGREMARGAEEALAKIDAVLDDDLRKQARGVQIHSFGTDMAEETRAALDLIEAAVEGVEKITFAYRRGDGAESRRTIRPLGLWFWGKVWTCVGWCELRKDYRMFRVDRMASLERGEKYKPLKGQTLREFYQIEDDLGRRLQSMRQSRPGQDGGPR
ncbi:MAG: YafY family protein [Pseudomonadota bacterium]